MYISAKAEMRKGKNAVILGILNQKGGVGKTTLAVNLALTLSHRYSGRILLIDADPQGSALDWATARGAAQPENPSLFAVVGMPRPTIHRELGIVADGCEHVVIDGPPRVTDLARSAIMASDLVLIPVQPSPYDIWAADEVVKLVEEARVYKTELLACFVINRRIANTAIGRDVRDALKQYSIPVLKTTIGQRVVFAEAAAQGKSVTEMDSGPASREIADLLDELIDFYQGQSQ